MREYQELTPFPRSESTLTLETMLYRKLARHQMLVSPMLARNFLHPNPFHIHRTRARRPVLTAVLKA